MGKNKKTPQKAWDQAAFKRNFKICIFSQKAAFSKIIFTKQTYYFAINFDNYFI